MRIKKALMCAATACVMLFAGCGGGSAKPREIKGFDGNTVDVAPKSGDLIATFEIEGFGEIKAVLFPEAAPVGVENFQKLCDAGYYEGLSIHRVISGFMLQGGSLNGDGTGGDAMVNGGNFSIETAQNARHFYGALCYANAGADYNSTQFYIVNNKKNEALDPAVLQENIDYYQGGVDYFNELGDSVSEEYYKEKVVYYQNMLDWFNAQSNRIKSRYSEMGGTPSLDGNYTVFGQVYEGFDVVDAISAVEVDDVANKPLEDIIIKSVSVSTFA